VKGETSVKIKEGDKVRSSLNGDDYKVKRIVSSMVVLESEDGQSQILTEFENLDLFYRQKESVQM
jgi:predicted DNA-binding antitoxin AbrB/MazE fold protein